MRLSVLLLLLLSVAVTQARRVPKIRLFKIPFMRPARISKPSISSGSKGTIQVHRKLEDPWTNPIKPFSRPNNAGWSMTWRDRVIPGRHILPFAADKTMNNGKTWTDSDPLEPQSNSQANINLGETGMNSFNSFSPLNVTALPIMWSDKIDRAISSIDTLPIAADKKPNNGTKGTDRYLPKPLQSQKIIQVQRYLRNTGMNSDKPFSPLNYTALLMMMSSISIFFK